ncbi:unnamed protein product, partial [marine sediment metagenome]
MNQKYFLVSAAPHIRTEEDIPKIMYAVVLALIPAAGIS